MPNVDEQRGKAATKRAESEQSEEKGDRQEGDGDPKDESEEATAKIKGRSRFTAALRSLSKTKTKRERELDKSTDRETRSAEEEAQETPGELEDVASSISTDSGALGKTKKKSLTRRLLLGGLRKVGKRRRGGPTAWRPATTSAWSTWKQHPCHRHPVRPPPPAAARCRSPSVARRWSHRPPRRAARADPRATRII